MMHHCLQVPEILLQIFEFTTSGPHDVSVLANLARTCSLFFEVAADLLWAPRNLDDLVQLMPRDLWKPKATNAKYFIPLQELQFSRPIQPSDLSSFFRYSHRIRKISTVRTSDDFFRALKNAAPDGVNIFPNILSITYSSEDSIERVNLVSDLFLGPSLRDLVIFVAKTTCDLELLLTQVTQRSRNLSTIHVFVESRLVSDELSELFCNFICRYKPLQTIDIDGIVPSYRLVQHAASLPFLHFLRWSPATFVPESGFIPSLGLIEGFHYNAKQDPTKDSLAGFISFVEMLEPRTKVPELMLMLPCRTTSAEITRTFELLSERWSHETLRSIDFKNPEQTLGYTLTCTTNHIIPLNFTPLARMLPFCNLKRVILNGSSPIHGAKCTFEVDDDELIAMGDSWPVLELLGIQTTGFKITLRGFLGLVKRCPKLSYINLDEMDFNAESYEWPDEISEIGYFPALTTLQVENSRTDDGEKVLELFLEVFPELKVHKFTFGIDTDHYREWRIVEKGLPRWSY